MSGKKETASGQHNVKIQPFKLRGDAAKLFAIYSNLNDSKRRLLEDLLMKHIFLLGGMSNYRPSFRPTKSDEPPAGWGAWKWLYENVSADAADAWTAWAGYISSSYPTEKSRRDTILEFLGELVRLKFLEEPLPDDSEELLKQADLQLRK